MTELTELTGRNNWLTDNIESANIYKHSHIHRHYDNTRINIKLQENHIQYVMHLTTG